MSLPDRRAKVDLAKDDLSVRRPCELLAVARSGVYRPKSEAAASDLVLMRRLDELLLKLPFHGSRRMRFELAREGRAINRKHVQRLMRTMGIAALARARASPRRDTRYTRIRRATRRSRNPTPCGPST